MPNSYANFLYAQAGAKTPEQKKAFQEDLQRRKLAASGYDETFTMPNGQVLTTMPWQTGPPTKASLNRFGVPINYNLVKAPYMHAPISMRSAAPQMDILSLLKHAISGNQAPDGTVSGVDQAPDGTVSGVDQGGRSVSVNSASL